MSSAFFSLFFFPIAQHEERPLYHIHMVTSRSNCAIWMIILFWGYKKIQISANETNIYETIVPCVAHINYMLFKMVKIKIIVHKLTF